MGLFFRRSYPVSIILLYSIQFTSREWWLDDFRFYGLSKVIISSLPPAGIKIGTVDSEGQHLTNQLRISGLLSHIKREFKPCVSFPTRTNLPNYNYEKFHHIVSISVNGAGFESRGILHAVNLIPCILLFNNVISSSRYD